MSRDKKITDEQLEQEIKKGKNFRQIADEYGYGNPSKTLSQRVRKLGYTSNRLAKIRADGGVNIYIKPDDLEKMLEKAGVDPVEKDGDDALSYSFSRVTNDGCLVLKPHSTKWRKTD